MQLRRTLQWVRDVRKSNRVIKSLTREWHETSLSNMVDPQKIWYYVASRRGHVASNSTIFIFSLKLTPTHRHTRNMGKKWWVVQVSPCRSIEQSSWSSRHKPWGFQAKPAFPHSTYQAWNHAFKCLSKWVRLISVGGKIIGAKGCGCSVSFF